MKKYLLTIALLGALAPSIARAQDAPTTVAPFAEKLATVTPFISGLKEPQGLILDSNGDVIVCDYGAGEVLRFSKAGAKQEALASGLKGPSQIVTMSVSGRTIPMKNKNGEEVPETIWMVSERKANRVISIRPTGMDTLPYAIEQLGSEIVEPMGLLQPPSDFLRNPFPMSLMAARQGRITKFPIGTYAVAHTTSKIYRLNSHGIGDKSWTLVYEASDEDGDARYGLRCLANDGSTLFVSDEVNGDVLMMSQDGRMAKFASGFDDPSGLAIRGESLYVCDEGNGGQLWKVNKNGKKTLVAEKLGRPRNVLFLDDVTALVSDRDGRVLKLNWG